MDKKRRDLILAEAEAWQREGIIDAATLQRLQQRYEADGDGAARSWRAIILMSVGVLLVGLGLIALLAANWRELSRPLRAVIAFAPLTISVWLWVAGLRKGWRSRAFMEPLGIFWTIAVGLGLSLVAQTYQIAGSADDLSLVWGLLALPVVYATMAVAPAIFYYVAIFVWLCISLVNDLSPSAFWPLTLLAIPALVYIRNTAPRGPRFPLIAWPVLLLLLVAFGFTFEGMADGKWITIYSGVFGLMFAAGLILEREKGSLWQAPLRVIGTLGLVILFFLLTFYMVWDDLYRWSNNVTLWGLLSGRWLRYQPIGGLPLLVAAVSIGIYLHAKRRGTPEGEKVVDVATLFIGLMPLMHIVVAAMAAVADSCGFAAMATTGILVVMAGLVIASGLARRRLLWLNSGVLLLLAVVLSKFFSVDFSYTVRGAAFVICGIFFFLANWMASKRMRRRS